MGRLLFLPLLVLPVLPLGGAARDAGAAPPATPSAYEDLVREYTDSRPAAGGGFETRFDYGALRDREDGPELRAAIRKAFLGVDPGALAPATRIAWAVNAYNFFIIDLVTEHYVNAAGDTLRSITDLGKGDVSVFREKRFTLGGTRYSLDSFERRFVFGDADTTGGKRPSGLDPRLHFVLVCAARSCPPLLPVPSDSTALEAHLDFVVRNTLRNPAHLRMEPADPPRIRVSRLFDWYRGDFGAERGLREFLGAYAPARIGEQVRREGAVLDPSLDWDWSLNDP
jgi:hypothetical protein